jgi:hypothetical protein
MKILVRCIASIAPVVLMVLSYGPARIHAITGGPGDSDEALLQRRIVAKEREELEFLKTGDLKRFGDLLADDAIFVDDHGAAAKSEVVENTRKFRLIEYAIDNVKFVSLSTASGLVSYKISEKGTSNGREFAAQVYVSALWAERGGKLVCVFSQETAAK